MRKRVRVLHVDDDPEFADLTATYLERVDETIDVATASGADEGLKYLADTAVDCVVSDYEMPGTDGLDFLDAVRETYPDLPFILFTGKGSEEIASEAISAGVTDYLQKKSTTDQFDLLANRVANAVQRYDIERERTQWKRAIETASEGIAIVTDGTFDQMNDAYASAHGERPDTLLGTEWRRWYPDEEVTRLAETVLPSLDPGEDWEGEVVGRRGDGSEFEQALSLSRLADGGLVWVAEDITERKERERELQRQNERMEELIRKHEAAETRYRSLFENNPIVIWEEDLSTVADRLETLAEDVEDLSAHLEDREVLVDLAEDIETVDVNEYALDYYAADSKAHLVENLDELLTERSYETLRKEFLAIARGETEITLETRSRTFDGEFRDELIHVFVPETYDGYSCVYITATDITERKDRERTLERQNDLFRKAQAIADVGAWEYDVRNDELTWTAEVYEIHDLPEDSDVSSKEAIEFYHPEDRQTIREALGRAVTECEPFDLELRLITAEGDRRWVRSWGDPQTEDDEVARVRGTFQNITERKERERETDLFRQMAQSLGVGLAVYGSDGRFEYVNPTAAEIVDSDTETLRGRAIWEANPEVDRERFDTYWSSFSDGETRVHETVLQFGGVEVPVQTVTTQQTIHGETYHFGTVQDITERIASERELQRQNERLAEFASIVSHDLRNPLDVAQGHLDLVREECDSDRIDSVERAHERMETLIDDLLTLAREGNAVEGRTVVDLASVVEACWKTVETERATLVVETDRTVSADRSRLRQLLENLVRNAVEHGGDGVTITVGDLPDGFYVADDGPGVPSDRREAVFERGYTTSERGTGFGLPIVRETARAHGWSVRVVESQAGGARFEITGLDGS